MAEKAFKVPSLGLVGTTAELDFASGDLRWNALPLATESYVDSAVSGVTVNVEAIAGSGLTYGAQLNELNVNPGIGIWINSDTVAVNANALAGNGLTGGWDSISVNPGTGIYITGDAVAVNVNALYDTGGPLTLNNEKLDVNVNTISQLLVTSWGAKGLYRDAYDTIGVNVNAIAGSGLYSDASTAYTTLAINTNVIATREYVDAATAGLNVHDSVKAATTTGITISTDLEAGDIIDGVTLVAGDRVLVKNQSPAGKPDQGVYVVQASGAAVRADDYNTAGEVDAGDFIFVEAGTVNGKTGWVQTNKITTIGTDEIAFTQFSGAGTYIAGDGLDIAGNVFSVNTGAGIRIVSDAVAINATAIAGDGLSSDISGGVLSVNPGFGIAIVSDAVAVNTNALAGDGLTGGFNNLAVNPGAGIHVTSDQVAVNANALAGTALIAGQGFSGILSVNTNAVAQSLVGIGLYVADGDNLNVNTNAISFGSHLTIFTGGADRAISRTSMFRAATTAANTYVTAGVIPFDDGEGRTFSPKAFSADILLSTSTGKRVSKIMGYADDDTGIASYTEYGIVESGETIDNVDVEVIKESTDWKLRFKGTSNTKAIVEMKTMGEWSI